MRRARLSLLLVLAVSISCISAAAIAQEAKSNAATKPVPRDSKWWKDRHESMNARVKQGNVELLLIGDSITHGWERGGKEVWEKFYTPATR